MLIVKVWCLPANQTEDGLRKLHKTIVETAARVKELKIKDETDMTCLFPPDLMNYGLGDEIIVEVAGIPKHITGFPASLARKIGLGVHALYPNARIHCRVEASHPNYGVWTSRKAR